MKQLQFVYKLVLVSAILALIASPGFAQDNETDTTAQAEEVFYEVEITNASWAEEWVEITNFGESAQDFTSWTLQDEANHVYKFPEEFILVPEAAIKVHTFEGNDTSTDLYMNRKRAIWNDNDDVATLIDNMSNVVDQYPEEVEEFIVVEEEEEEAEDNES